MESRDKRPEPILYTSIGTGKPPVIRDFPAKERPRERLCTYGAAVLKNEELMAILLRTGIKGENVLDLSKRLLLEFGDLDGIARASYEDLSSQRGISMAKACQLLAGIELGRRVSSPDPRDLPTIVEPKHLAALFSARMAYLEHEELHVVLMNTKNQVVGTSRLYKGTVNSALVRPAEVFALALKRSCPAISVVHNHPSGDPTPSDEDIETTTKLVKAGSLLEVDLLDHVVIGHGKYVSMRERGLGFKKGPIAWAAA